MSTGVQRTLGEIRYWIHLSGNGPFEMLIVIFCFLQILYCELCVAEYELPQSARGRRRMVVFFCTSGHATCRNGGEGPAITYRNQGQPMCVCMCPVAFSKPHCEPF